MHSEREEDTNEREMTDRLFGNDTSSMDNFSGISISEKDRDQRLEVKGFWHRFLI
jgi:hypothetical protein